MTLETVVFGLVALALLGGSLGVVLTPNLFHAVLCLAGALVATAVIFLLLDAAFLFAVQLLLYAGGVVTILVFAIMLTERLVGERITQTNRHVVNGAVMSVALFVGVAGFIAIGGHDLKRAVCRKRLIVLRDLIALGQVGIKIILAREDRSLVDVQSQRQRCARAEFDRAPIQHRQRARQTETHGTRVRVGRVAKMRRAAAKDFRRGVQLRMDLEADDGFPGVHSFRFQVKGSCPHSYASTRRMGSFDNKTRNLKLET